MKALNIIATAVAMAAVSAFGEVEIRNVTFAKDEIPKANPRVETRNGVATHVEVFGFFDVQEDGSVNTTVIEYYGDIPTNKISALIENAQERQRVLPTWKSKFEISTNETAIARAVADIRGHAIEAELTKLCEDQKECEDDIAEYQAKHDEWSKIPVFGTSIALWFKTKKDIANAKLAIIKARIEQLEKMLDTVARK